MLQSIKEKINLYIIKNPRGVIITTIIVLNIIILMISSLIINLLMRDSFGNVGFWRTIYYTVGMILDAGMIENIIVDVGSANTILVIVCLLTIVIGSITFTGAIIGYVTNYISNFIDNANSNSRPIHISGHTVILNWNTRASEIINDMLYLDSRETIIVLVNTGAEQVKKEINERIYLTLHEEKRIKNKLNVIVREGSTYSTKQLNDVSILTAKTILLLGDDDTKYICRYDVEEKQRSQKGNANTIKTLVQVSEMASSEQSADNQRIIVEVEDEWTQDVVKRIIMHKERLGKCNIVPILVNRILGQILSQFCIFPELNKVYSELFSNKGAEFFCISQEDIHRDGNEETIIDNILSTNPCIIPMSFLDTKTGHKLFYMARSEEDYAASAAFPQNTVNVEINDEYWLENRNVIILGHNSKIKEIMSGFDVFRSEWNKQDGTEILNIMVIDDKRSLEKQDYYQGYSYVNKVVEAEIYDKEIIKTAINNFIDSNLEDTSILVLSDDLVPEKDIDSYTLTNLVYVQDIIYDRVSEDPSYDTDKIDVIVEILNPKNYDVVHNYNIDNIVISNRYISKMVTQIGEKIELYEFYEDVLTYDTMENDTYESKEIYVKPVRGFLKSMPEKCKASDLIRAVYAASPHSNRPMLIGIARRGGKYELFDGDQREKEVVLNSDDKLIMYSCH